MSLSNTATPIYYGIFRDQVLSGERPVNEHIAQQMHLIDDLISDPRYYYDDCAVQGFIDFCEGELTLTDGTPMKMLFEFKLWAEDIFGWYEFEERSVYETDSSRYGGRYVRKWIKKRLRKKQMIITARGAAKSMYQEAIQMFFLNVDGTSTSQCVTAPTMAQAEEVLNPMRTAIVRAHGPLFQLLTDGSMSSTRDPTKRPKLFASKKGIENRISNSLICVRPMSIDKLQGYRDKIISIDEWLSGDTREDVIGTVEQSASKNSDYLIVATSSEGTVRNSVGDTIKMELLDILKGDYYNPHISIWYYRLDDVSEVNDPRMWIKANPNIGQTVSYETYQLEVERAEKVPSARNDILAKRFGIPMEGYTYFFTYEETKRHPPQSFYRMQCSMGMDASQGDDFWSFTWLFPMRGGRFGAKTLCYISERTMMLLPHALRLKYEEFLEEGSLRVMQGAVLDPMEIYEDVERFIDEMRYDVSAFGFDPYNAKGFVDRWTMENGPYGVETVRQGARTESVPLGEIKHLVGDRMLLFDQAMMQFTLGNAITIEDTNGNRKLYKKRADAKIDSVAALMDALVAYKIHKDLFD